MKQEFILAVFAALVAVGSEAGAPATSLVEDFESHGQADLRAVFASRLPIQVMLATPPSGYEFRQPRKLTVCWDPAERVATASASYRPGRQEG
jgi:hypothetical protein